MMAPSTAPGNTSWTAHLATVVLEKALTGIAGFDEITGGGLPWGRTTLLIGYNAATKNCRPTSQRREQLLAM